MYRYPLFYIPVHKINEVVINYDEVHKINDGVHKITA